MNPDKIKTETQIIDAIFTKITSIYGDNAKRYTSLFETVKKLKGSNNLFKEALTFPDSRIPDFIVELLFASYFFENGFTVEIIPRSNGQKTPDLLISKNTFRGFVEIKHIHKKHDGPSVVQLNELAEMDMLEPYGDHVRDEKYCRDKILEGFQQIQQYSGLTDTDEMIVAIWNSDEDLDDLNMKFTVSNLIEERNEFNNLSNQKWIVFGSPWYSIRKNTQFHIFRV